MTIESAIARANAISIEAKLTGHAKRADGGLNLRFMVHPHGIPKALQDAPIGTRYVVALCEIDEFEQPVKQETTAHKPPPSPHPEPAGAMRKPVAPEKRLAQKAALLCKDSLFRKFLTLNTHYADDEPTVAQYLRVLCNVDSRSEIIPGTSAAEKFEDIATRFVVWRDLPDRENAE